MFIKVFQEPIHHSRQDEKNRKVNEEKDKDEIERVSFDKIAGLENYGHKSRKKDGFKPSIRVFPHEKVCDNGPEEAKWNFVSEIVIRDFPNIFKAMSHVVNNSKKKDDHKKQKADKQLVDGFGFHADIFYHDIFC